MRSTHRITLAVALAVSAAAGTAAATQTVHLGADATEAPMLSASQLASQKAKLAAADRSIDSALAARPPALPKVPKFAPLGEPSVPPVVVTRVIPVASAAADTYDEADDGPARGSGTHRTPAAEPSPATASPATRASAPAHADRDEGEDRESSSDREEADHAEDRDHDSSDGAQAEPEHGDED